MNDVFRVSESSDANSAAFSRLAVPIFTRRSTRTTRLFTAIRTTRSATSCGVIGRPRRRRALAVGQAK